MAPLAGKTAVVIGGTKGIGRGIAEWLAQNGASVIIAGRSVESGKEVVESMTQMAAASAADANPTFRFVPIDASLISDVVRFGNQVSSELSRLDFLVMTPGFARFDPRTETAEGNDQKMATHYYGRVAAAQTFMPLLERTAAQPDADVRVLTVLSAGFPANFTGYRTDPELRTTFSVKNCADATGLYNDVAMTCLAEAHPTVTFVHANPGFVATNWGSGFHPVLRAIVRFVQLFGRSPAQCAEYLSKPLVAPDWKGGARFSNDRGNPTTVNPLVDDAKEVVWANTNEVIARATQPKQ